MKKIYQYFWIVSLVLLLTGSYARAQGQTVSGAIKDKDGSALPGVSILIKGTSLGTTSDGNGNYSINAASGSVLVFSFIGYKTTEVTVGNESAINVSLEEDPRALEEIVVVGYGEQKKKLVTGANSQISGEVIQRQNQLNPLQSLQGQVSGVNITSTSGQPGSDLRVVIRGMGTIGNASPLYVVDGIPGGDITVINPLDIASIDFLKDAASAAIYGAQAANGVVLVTTRTGHRGKGQVTFDMYTGWQSVPRQVDLLNAGEYKMIMNEQALNSGSAPIDFESMDGLANTDWMNYMIKDNTRISNYSLGFSGGSESSLYSLSLNYIDQEGVVGGKDVSYYERYGARLNSEHKLYGEVLKVGQHLNFNFIKNNGINVGNQYNNTMRGAYITSPLSPVYSDNNIFDSPYNDTSDSPWFNGDGNPYGLMMTNSNNRNVAQRILADVYAELEPVRNLTLKSVVGFNYYASGFRSYTPLYQFSVYSLNTDHTTTSQSMSSGNTLTFINTATYDFSIGNDHTLTALIGFEAQRSNGTSLSGSNWNLLSQFNDFSHAYLGNTTGQAHVDAEGNVVETRVVGGGPSNAYRRSSYFGRISYAFKERYVFNATLRRDGSSKFAPGNQWGTFPSVSAGWILSSEDFYSGSSVSSTLNFFKLRASWGQVGNQSIDDFMFAAPINTSTNFTSDNPAAFYTFGTSNLNVPGAYPSRLSNPDLTWETSEQTNIGFDGRLFNSRLDVVFDFYVKTTKDWLVTPPILATVGTNAPVINGGSVKNSGIELGFNWDDKIGEVNYFVGLNGAYNKNTVGKIPTEDGIIHGRTNMLYDNSEEFYRAKNGHAIGYFWGYETAGVFQTQDEIDQWLEDDKAVLQEDVKPGDVKYVDQNGDGFINNADKVNLGNGMPKITFGFNFGFDYKGFDFSVYAFGAIGNKIVQSYRNHTNKQANYTSAILDRWTGEGTSNRLPRVTETNINWQFSDLYLHDGDFLRISNVVVGYDLKRLIKWNTLSQFRVYVQGQNLLTFTKYDGMDPEVGYGTDGWVSGVDLGYYPRPRIFMVGANIKF